MVVQEQALPLPGVAPDRTGKYRTDHLLVAATVVIVAPSSTVTLAASTPGTARVTWAHTRCTTARASSWPSTSANYSLAPVTSSSTGHRSPT